MLWLVLPLLGILIWRMARRQRIRRGEKGNGAEAEQLVRQGADSAFFAIEQRLVAAGHERRSGECSTSWIRRLAESGALPDAAVLMRDILPLHYRYRFHPAGLDEDDRRALASRVREWLARNPARRA